jgi:hypothetical protein
MVLVTVVVVLAALEPMSLEQLLVEGLPLKHHLILRNQLHTP